MNKGEQMAYHQGIADWLRYHKRVPVYYRGTDLESSWKAGFAYAERWNRGV